jgi:hypothetical protein
MGVCLMQFRRHGVPARAADMQRSGQKGRNRKGRPGFKKCHHVSKWRELMFPGHASQELGKPLLLPGKARYKGGGGRFDEPDSRPT